MLANMILMFAVCCGHIENRVVVHAISILCGQWCIAILFNVVFLSLPGIRFPKQIISPALLYN